MNEPPENIRAHPLWGQIAPHVRIEVYGRDGGPQKPRFRLEFDKDVTRQQKVDWTQITVKCVECGKPIHPIRSRKKGGRAEGIIGHIYLAVGCPLDVRVGCSRGNAANDEYWAIRADVEARKATDPAQTQLMFPVEQCPTVKP